MWRSIRDREVILAGGSGGLGSVAARALADEGARLTVSYLKNAERAELLRDVAQVVTADLTVAADRARLLDAAPSLYGVVVFSGMPARSADAAAESMRVNYEGPAALAREAAERMRVSGVPGSIVVLSTMQGAALFPNSTAYAAPKAALIHAMRILAKECRGGSGIRVNVICPGVMRAGMALASIEAGKYQRYLDDGSIGRYGEAEDVARAVRYFLEPDQYVTGQVMVVDGGLTL